MKSVAFGPTSCSSGLVPKNKFLHSPEAQYGFVPKLSLHGGKNPALRAEKPFLAKRCISLRGTQDAPQQSSSQLDSAFGFHCFCLGRGLTLRSNAW